MRRAAYALVLALLLAGNTIAASVELEFPVRPLVVGPMGSPTSGADKWDQFRSITHPEKFSAVLLDGRVVVRNVNDYGQGDGHSTVGTGRDLPRGSTACAAFDWRYDALVQTGRNLVFQVQMDGSPIVAVSTLSGSWTVVDRVGGTTHRKALGPIPWTRWAYFVACAHLDDSNGYVNLWWAVDAWPDVTKPPVFTRSGDTWQGRTAHMTVGQYSDHSKPGSYVGYFSAFGRAATPARAVELAK